MTKLIIDCETTGLSPVVKNYVKQENGTEKVIREHKRLICISVLDLENKELKSFYGEDEKKFMIEFFEYVDKLSHGDQVVGFNLEFDINFIRVRAFYHKLKIPFHLLYCEKVDLRKIISSEEYAVGTLTFWGEACGVKADTNNGSKMPEFYVNKDWESIKKHSEEDCKITSKLYERCKEVGLI